MKHPFGLATGELDADRSQIDAPQIRPPPRGKLVNGLPVRHRIRADIRHFDFPQPTATRVLQRIKRRRARVQAVLTRDQLALYGIGAANARWRSHVFSRSVVTRKPVGQHIYHASTSEAFAASTTAPRSRAQSSAKYK